MAAIRHTVFLPLWSLPYVYSAVRRGYHPIPSKLPPDGNNVPPYSDSHTTSQDLIYLSDMDELYCWSMRILKDADRQPVYFVNQTQFTKQASDSLDNTAFAYNSDGFFDGIKPPHAPSTGKKHIL